MLNIGGKILTYRDYIAIVLNNERFEIEQTTFDEANENFQFLKTFSSDKVIYGINTGFGPMAQFKIPYADRLVLQYNLIRSHASGMGNPIAYEYCRAMLLDRLSTFMQCKSGVHIDLIVLIAQMLDKDMAPVIYEHGGVGASGDLVQLAHMALAITGEGEVWHKGKIVSASKAFDEEGITPFAIRLREGLAMMNGTSCMTGIGLVNVHYAEKLLQLSCLVSVTINEIMGAFDDHLSEALNEVKLHEGQNEIASIMRNLVSESTLLRSRQEHLYKETQETEFKEKVQEYYSLRCTPQILGPIYDTISNTKKILEQELNSVSDNPVIDHKRKNVFHGGNFHGDYVALEMDKLKIAVTKLSMLAERQLNYLLNDKLNGKLPPFINTGTIGLNFGIQGIQYTATSTVAENQTLSNPLYVHSIPSNNDNQDIVSMGSNAALMASKVIDNAFHVLSVQCLALIQAIDYLGKKEQLSPEGKKLFLALNIFSNQINEDMPSFGALKSICNYLKNDFSLTAYK
jgi:histidine ammonia-lyase